MLGRSRTGSLLVPIASVVAVAHEALADAAGCRAAGPPSTAAGQPELGGDRRPAQVEVDQHRAQVGLVGEAEGEVERHRGLAAVGGRRGDARRASSRSAACARRMLVRIMSKVACAGSTSAKVTMRFALHQPRVGLEGGELAPGRAGPAAAARRARARRARRRRRRGLAPLFLGLLDGGLDAFHGRLSQRLAAGRHSVAAGAQVGGVPADPGSCARSSAARIRSSGR